MLWIVLGVAAYIAGALWFARVVGRMSDDYPPPEA